MLEFLGDALGAIASGGLTGLIGSGITLFGEYKKQKLNYDHEEKMSRLQMESESKRSEYELKGIEAKSKAEVDKTDAESFGKAIESDKATYSDGDSKLGGVLLPIVDFFRGMLRPVVTIWFCGLSFVIYKDLEEMVSKVDVNDYDQVMSVHNNVTLVLLYLTCMSVTYWFGTRIKTQKPMERLFKG